MERIGRTDLNLLLNGLSRVEPVLDIVGIGELQAEVILFDQVQSVENLLV